MTKKLLNMKRNIVAGTVISLVLYGCSGKSDNKATGESQYTLDSLTTAMGSGMIQPIGGIVNLAAPQKGVVKKVMVKSGELVEKGQPLIELENTEQSISLSEARENYQTLQAEVQSAQINYQQALIELNKKQKDYRDGQALFQAKAMTANDLLNLLTAYESQKATSKRLENEVNIARKKAFGSNYNVASINKTYGDMTFKAPSKGRIIDLDLKPGEAIETYKEYAVLAPSDSLEVKAEMDELVANRIREGQKCTIKSLADNSVVATGTVKSMSPDLKKKSIFSDTGDDMQDRRIRIVYISLDKPDNLLIGSKVSCEIKIK